MRNANESGTWNNQELRVYLWQVMGLMWSEVLRRNDENPGVANHVMLDDVWALLRTPGGVAAIENMARRFRKRRGALWMTSQQIGEFLEKEHGRQSRLQGLGDVGSNFASEAVCGTRGQTRAKGLDGAAGVVDEQGAGADDGVARSHHGQVYLSLGGSMVDGREQFGIQACQTCEGLRVSSITLARIVVDGPELTRIGDQDIVSHIFEHMADPARE